MKIGKGAIIALSVLAVLVVGVVSVFGYVNSVRNEGISKEESLQAQYQSNQNELSSYTLEVTEVLGIADKNANKAKEIIVEAVKGRYDGNMEPGTGGSMFSAITEAYPDVAKNADAYAKAQDVVIAGRNAYKGKQNILLDQIRSYETWQEQGLFRSVVVDALGFPSDRLEAKVGDVTVTGAAALAKMKDIVLVKDATEAYETGETKAIITPESTETK